MVCESGELLSAIVQGAMTMGERPERCAIADFEDGGRGH